MLKSEQLSATQHILLEKDTQAQLVYWKQLLANSPTLELPTDRPRLRQQTNSQAQSDFTFPRELTDALKSLSSNTATTFYTTLVTAFKVVLHIIRDKMIFSSAAQTIITPIMMCSHPPTSL